MSWSSRKFFEKHNKPDLDREIAIVHEILSGNTPEWLFDFQEIKIGSDIVEVLPDYLCIGPDNDYVRVPMTNFAAQFLADYFHVALPTPELVALIWKNADCKLLPITPNWNYVPPLTGTLGTRFVDHSLMIDKQIQEHHAKISLVAGHKKDIVSDEPLLKAHPHHVIIYGWQQATGRPIQGEQWVHDWMYVDYSHGVRLIRDPSGKYSGKCCLNAPPTAFLKGLT